MPWPTPQDYNEAIQNPRQNFEDPELAAGMPETTALGLPRPITGNFASVYRLRCAGRDWAVRCFWREYSDMQQRYAAISRHLGLARLPYTVGFEYLARGIKVRGQWYPVLKMEWVEGDLLIPYIEQHLHDSEALLRLARNWRTMVSAMERAGVAHGDLQHGNVLVVGEQLKLVDYDGMYVPALHGKASHELGHQHYQHPARTAQDFAPEVDRFAGWVIYLSLLSVSRHAELWTQLQAGDECLLLRKSDFQAPSTSPGLAKLAGLGDDELRSLTSSFRAALAAGACDVPPLHEPTAVAGRKSGIGSILSASLRMFVPSVQMLTQPVDAAPGFGAAYAPPAAPMTTPPWLTDHFASLHMDDVLRGPRVPARVLTGASGASVIGAFALESIHVVASPFVLLVWCLATAIINGVLQLTWFHQNARVRSMKAVLRQQRRARRALAMIDRRQRQLDREQETRERRAARQRLRLEEEREMLIEHARAETEASQQRLNSRLERARDDLGDLNARQQKEISSALDALQAGYVRRELGRLSLRTARLAEVSPLLRLRLWTMGIRTAADVTSEGIAALRTLNESAMNSIVAWRVDAEVQARRSIPHVLPIDQLEQLTSKYSKERTRIEASERQARDEARRRMDMTTGDLERGCFPLDERLRRLETERGARELDLEQRVRTCEQERALAIAHLARIERELQPFRDVAFTRFFLATLWPS